MTAIIELLNPFDLPALLVGSVFAASVLQAATGIGFGVIAGPVLLVTMANVGAIQVSILLSFLIALLLSPITIPRVQWPLLKPLFLGVCIGTPPGALAFVMLPIDTLKLIAAIVVGFMTLVAAGLLARYPVVEQDSKVRRVFAGTICGFLNTTLAMPGPPIAAYATAIKSKKATIQATTLVTFLMAYPIALVLQTLAVGLSGEAVGVSVRLMGPTIVGTSVGLLISNRLPEQVFRWATIIFLATSVFILLAK
ncbi:sulfite exporter TauE/SafE family protein [Tropicibacter sp. Alg240-R139]|uniref:sulfite exporter TauE/SafE family protein n=1 Tax=Tropicibacter sp. Alg240-R139 TaxID=2305991 RepID=UPI0013DEA0C3|nr:sulfite exporter TauE/SafE family protein [Tropicibacter sp. Alg240-R139]